ncbi:unnamed protein product, partial [Urochloa humidicola]
NDDIGQGWLFRNNSATLTRTAEPPAKPNIDFVNSTCPDDFTVGSNVQCASIHSSEPVNRMLTRSATRGDVKLIASNVYYNIVNWHTSTFIFCCSCLLYEY